MTLYCPSQKASHITLSNSHNGTVEQTIGKIQYCGFAAITHTDISYPAEVTFKEIITITSVTGCVTSAIAKYMTDLFISVVLPTSPTAEQLCWTTHLQLFLMLACSVTIPESQNSGTAPGSHQSLAGNKSLTLTEQGMRLKAWIAARRISIGLFCREAHKLRTGVSEAAASPAFPMAFNTSCICKYRAR